MDHRVHVQMHMNSRFWTTWNPPTPSPAYQFTQHTLFMTRSPPNRLTNSSGVATVKSLLWPLDSVRWWPYLAMWCPDMDLDAIKQQHTTRLKHFLIYTQILCIH